jgi:hypothetical protein
MKTGITISTAALVPLLAMAAFVVPQSEAQEAQRIRVRRLTRPDIVSRLHAQLLLDRAVQGDSARGQSS